MSENLYILKIEKKNIIVQNELVGTAVKLGKQAHKIYEWEALDYPSSYVSGVFQSKPTFPQVWVPTLTGFCYFILTPVSFERSRKWNSILFPLRNLAKYIYNNRYIHAVQTEKRAKIRNNNLWRNRAILEKVYHYLSNPHVTFSLLQSYPTRKGKQTNYASEGEKVWATKNSNLRQQSCK